MVPLLPQLIQAASTGMGADAGTAGPTAHINQCVSCSSESCYLPAHNNLLSPANATAPELSYNPVILGPQLYSWCSWEKTNILIICFDPPWAPNTHQALKINDFFLLSPFLPVVLSLSWHDFGFSNQKSPEPTGVCVHDGKLNSFLHCNQTPHAGKLMSWSEEAEAGR